MFAEFARAARRQLDGYGLVRIDEMKARINRQYDKAAPEEAAPCQPILRLSP
jgi:hypothetical protein